VLNKFGKTEKPKKINSNYTTHSRHISHDSVILVNDVLSMGYRLTWRKGIFSYTAAKTSIFQVTYHQEQCRFKNNSPTVRILLKLSPGI